MDANGILNFLVQNLREKRDALKREIDALDSKASELDARKKEISIQLANKHEMQAAITEDTVHNFIAKWMHRGHHNPFPCPICFAVGRDSQLKAIAGNDTVEPLKCAVCGEVFNIPAE